MVIRQLLLTGLLMVVSCELSAADDVAALQVRIVALQQENAELAADSVTYRELNRYEDNGGNAWDADQPSKEVLELLGLRSDQVQALRDAISHTQSQLVAEVSKQGAQVAITQGVATLVIPDFSKEGGRISDEFEQRLGAIMGKQRALYYHTLRRSEDEHFLCFGQGRLTLTLSTAHGLSFTSNRINGTAVSSGAGNGFPDDVELLKPLFPPPFGGTAGVAH